MQFPLRLLLFLTRLLQGFAQQLQTFGLLHFLLLLFLESQLADSQLLAQFVDGFLLRICGEQVALIDDAPLALCQAFNALLQLLDARLLHFGLTARPGAALVEAVPLFLPAVHG